MESAISTESIETDVQYLHELEFVYTFEEVQPRWVKNSLVEQSGKITYTPIHRLYATGEGSRQYRRVSQTSLTSIQIRTLDVQERRAFGKCHFNRID